MKHGVQNESTETKEPSDKAGFCSFTEQDLFNKRVYSKDGKLVGDPAAPIRCSNCNNYVTKESGNRCVSMEIYGSTDDSANKNRLCDDTNPKNDKNNCIGPANFCLASLGLSKKCSF
jgi:hypothetical protein